MLLSRATIIHFQDLEPQMPETVRALLKVNEIRQSCKKVRRNETKYLHENNFTTGTTEKARNGGAAGSSGGLKTSNHIGCNQPRQPSPFVINPSDCMQTSA